MSSTDPAAAILPFGLGTVAAFDQNVFPLAYYEDDGGDLNKGSILIRATLEEMERIGQLGIDLNENDDFIFNTRISIEGLKAQKAKLQRKTYNPFKVFRNSREARLFHEASRSVYLETKHTSEKIHRDSRTQVVPSGRIRMIDGAILPPETVIRGIVIPLPNGLDDNAKRTLNDATETIANTSPFDDDPLISQLRDGEQAMTLADAESVLSQGVPSPGVDDGNRASVASSDLQLSRPTSPQTIIINQIHNSILNANSSLPGLTYNHGSQNSGSSVTQQFVP